MRNKVLSIQLSTGSYVEFIDKIIRLSENRTSSYVCVANVHMCIEAYRNPDFCNVVNQADLVTPDGMPLVFALKALYGIRQDRVAGMDLLPDLLRQAEKNKLSVFFYGGTPEMLEQTNLFITDHYPLLTQKQFYSPPFRNLLEEEQKEIVNRINEFGAHLVFVVLGCPKQEKFMASMKDKINACMIGIGGALPVMIGLQKRAPNWVQKIGFEWLFRLMQEPKRLFKRYLITNTLFIYLFLKEFIKVIVIGKNKA